MRAISRTSARARHPSTLGLLARQVVYQLKLLVRSPMAAFATLVIPLMVLLAVNFLYSGTHLASRGGITFAQFFTPAMAAFAVVNACYMSVISSTTLAREQGILKRIRSTPLPPWVYMTGRVVSSGLVAVVGAAVVIAVGAGLYDFQMVWAGVPAVLVTLAVAMFCFCSLGLAVSVLVPTVDSAVPIAWGTMLPLSFISDVFQPIDNAPHWLRATASFFPLRPFADALESAFNPITGSTAIHPAHLEVMALWGLAGAAFALLAFRWEPDGRHHGGQRARRSAGFAANRVRALLDTRVTRPGHQEELDKQHPATRAGRRRDASQSEKGQAPGEWSEGPAPGEDSSAARKTVAPTPRSTAASPTTGSQRSPDAR